MQPQVWQKNYGADLVVNCKAMTETSEIIARTGTQTKSNLNFAPHVFWKGAQENFADDRFHIRMPQLENWFETPLRCNVKDLYETLNHLVTGKPLRVERKHEVVYFEK